MPSGTTSTSALVIVSIDSLRVSTLAAQALAQKLVASGRRVSIVNETGGPLLGQEDRGDRRPTAGDAALDADVILVLAKLDPAKGAEHLREWAASAVAFVTAGRSSVTKLEAHASMIRGAALHLRSVVLIGADRERRQLGHLRGPVRRGAPSSAIADRRSQVGHTIDVTAILASGVRSGPEPRSHGGRERLGRVIWLLLFLNVLPFSGIPTVIPISTSLGQLVTQGALAAATVLVLVLNRRLLVRPNLYLTLITLLGASSMAASMRMVSGTGTLFRGGRFCVFILVLWLLTPLWTRRDLLLRWHMIALMLALSTVVLGALVKPGGAYSAEGRLQGDLWPIPPTQVAHYAALLAGITFVLLVAGSVHGRLPWCIGLCSCAILLLAHTRTATIAMIAAGGVAALSLITIRRRARLALIVACIVVVLAGTVFAPAIASWFTRGFGAQRMSAASTGGGRFGNSCSTNRDPTSSRFSALASRISRSQVFRSTTAGSRRIRTRACSVSLICAATFVSLLMIAATRHAGPTSPSRSSSFSTSRSPRGQKPASATLLHTRSTSWLPRH